MSLIRIPKLKWGQQVFGNIRRSSTWSRKFPSELNMYLEISEWDQQYSKIIYKKFNFPVTWSHNAAFNMMSSKCITGITGLNANSNNFKTFRNHLYLLSSVQNYGWCTKSHMLRYFIFEFNPLMPTVAHKIQHYFLGYFGFCSMFHNSARGYVRD